MNKKERIFIDTVIQFYRENGRHNLVWRMTQDPYRILVSELMLQQTQVDRVVSKYAEFLQAFPDAQSLSRATLAEVLRVWQGLGYNRRARSLHTCAKVIVCEHNNIFPKTYEELIQLPGIGPYTAGAVMAFAFNTPVAIIETNIRSAYLHHFFADEDQVDDAQILELIRSTLDRTNPREWYFALMDYGNHIKKTFGNPNAKSRQYTKQSKFEGSDRQIRGAILRMLADRAHTRKDMLARSTFEDIRMDAQLEHLLEEGMVVRLRSRYSLPE